MESPSCPVLFGRMAGPFIPCVVGNLSCMFNTGYVHKENFENKFAILNL